MGSSEARSDATTGRPPGALKSPLGSRIPETQRLQMLNEISRALTSRLDLRDVYDTIYEQISRVMDTSMFFLAVATRDNQAHLPYVREFGVLSLDVSPPQGRSVTTHVIELGEPLLFHNTQQYELYAMSHGLPVIILGDESRGEAESMIYAPLNTGSATIGTLSVQSTRQYAYSTEDLDTLRVIASQAAVAIQNAQLYQASVESSRRRQSLLKVAETVNSSLELPTVLRSILDSINDVIPYHLAAIMLPDHRAKVLDTMGAVGGMSEQRWREMKVPFGSGITGACFTKAEVVLVGDVTKFPAYIAGSEMVRSEVAVPLRRDQTVVGVLNVERTECDAFSDDDVELLTLFATQAAIAIENARLFEQQRKRAEEMQAIEALVQQMTRLHEYGAMSELIEQGLRNLIDLDECIVFLVDSERNQVVPVLTADQDSRLTCLEGLPRNSRPVGEGISGWIAKTSQSAFFESTKTDPRVSNDIRDLPWDKTIMGAPMMSQNKVSGVITVSRDVSEQFTQSELTILEIVASHGAIGFDRCRLYEELRLQATTDGLTGLFNRRYLTDRMNEEKSRAMRNNHPLAAIMIDADDFKRINDEYGHDAGDVVLEGLAQLLRSEVRTEDIVARYGGEEFLMLLPEVDAEGATLVADRLCRLVSRTILGRGDSVTHIHVSVGVSTLRDGDEAEELITRADQAMYEAKRRGGNRVCLAGPNGYEFPSPSRQPRGARQAA